MNLCMPQAAASMMKTKESGDLFTNTIQDSAQNLIWRYHKISFGDLVNAASCLVQPESSAWEAVLWDGISS